MLEGIIDHERTVLHGGKRRGGSLNEVEAYARTTQKLGANHGVSGRGGKRRVVAEGRSLYAIVEGEPLVKEADRWGKRQKKHTNRRERSRVVGALRKDKKPYGAANSKPRFWGFEREETGTLLLV